MDHSMMDHSHVPTNLIFYAVEDAISIAYSDVAFRAHLNRLLVAAKTVHRTIMPSKPVLRVFVLRLRSLVCRKCDDVAIHPATTAL